VSLFFAVLRRPRLWSTAIIQTWRLAVPGWWHQPPFLPVPTREYRAMRSTIQYGDPDRSIEPDDLLKYLTWCKAEGSRR